MNYINYNKLNKLAEDLRDDFHYSEPFPHLIIDNFLTEKNAKIIARKFPNSNSINWTSHGSGANADSLNFKGVKLQCSDENEFPDEIKDLMREFNSQSFLNFLKKLTNVEYIFGDPYYNGCGLHSTGKGGRLMIHADVNRHPYPSLADQYLNCIFYVSEKWKKSWGGELELWDDKVKNCIKSIYPKFNRLVIFRTERRAFHGHPLPIECPEKERRNSLAAYYYVPIIPKNEIANNQIQTVMWKKTNKYDEQFSIKYLKYLVNIFLIDFTPPIFLRKLKELRNLLRKWNK